MNLTLYSSEEITGLLNEHGFIDIRISYFKAFWVPFKGHMVPKGMVVLAKKDNARI